MVRGYHVILRGWSSLQVFFLLIFVWITSLICAHLGQPSSIKVKHIVKLMSGFYIQASYSVLTFSVGATLLGQDMLYRSNRAEKNKYQVTVVPSVRALLKNLSVRLSLFIYSCFFFLYPRQTFLYKVCLKNFTLLSVIPMFIHIMFYRRVRYLRNVYNLNYYPLL